ncbi:phosphoribosylamine--glycine ligase [Marinilactibacillus kalidii]|uniref:phosphoribosylamine--glycine ligase n=1 Tax=Marinilactibacillus kalidii TaxID=2820274 RepID=UPI001ABE7F5A|nr:phosphoribosylamine--glycine ligase [Marinilactibacillus kalidii]
MKLLVIGSGGREHAIASKLNQSPLTEKVYCVPGNPGMALEGIFTADISLTDHEKLMQFAVDHEIEWTIIGPEVPLFNGLADDFHKNGLRVFGPSKAATLIEASKAFAKELMDQQQIPTAAYQVFSDYQDACRYVEKQGAPIVIKADGLASGKGVVVAQTVLEAQIALKEMMQDHKFGQSASQVVIEECLVGEEFSLMAFVNGEEVYPMPISQDHKRLLENDQGPNTGGMGAYSPVPHISASIVDEAIRKILIPAAKGLADSQTPFTGVLYAGIISTDAGPKTIEFNARFGDPETQVVLNRLESDLAQVITDLLEDKKPNINWKKSGVDLGVVVAAKGYPATYAVDIPIHVGQMEETTVYYAGVKEMANALYSNGGRVYLIEAQGSDILDAQRKVYNQLMQLDTKQLVYRKDIGDKAKRR